MSYRKIGGLHHLRFWRLGFVFGAGVMTSRQWLYYLRKHPGRYEAANHLCDTMLWQVLLGMPRQEIVDNIAALMTGFHSRIMELRHER